MDSTLYDVDKVSSLIKSYRETHQVRKSDFAKLIGVHPAHLSRILSGKMCSPEALARIAALGKVPIGDLMLDASDDILEEIRGVGLRENIPVTV